MVPNYLWGAIYLLIANSYSKQRLQRLELTLVCCRRCGLLLEWFVHVSWGWQALHHPLKRLRRSRVLPRKLLLPAPKQQVQP